MVLVDESTGWVAFFCSDPVVGVADVLGYIEARFALELAFRDVKDTVGPGQQQVRAVAGNIGVFQLFAWAFTVTEAWARGRNAGDLVGYRTASPWDGARAAAEPRRRAAGVAAGIAGE